MFDLKSLLGFGPNRLTDAVAMLCTPLESAQDQHVQCSLHELNAILIRVLGRHISLADILPEPQVTIADVLLVTMLPRRSCKAAAASGLQERTGSGESDFKSTAGQ